ncbi:hypothetical protein WICPIJ_008387, partial [Wickerhamomyces pijperi]
MSLFKRSHTQPEPSVSNISEDEKNNFKVAENSDDSSTAESDEVKVGNIVIQKDPTIPYIDLITDFDTEKERERRSKWWFKYALFFWD